MNKIFKQTHLLKMGWTLLSSVLFLYACSEPPAEGWMSGEVKIDGSSTVFPISEAVAEEFLYVYPRIRVTVGVSGTGGGFNKFLSNEIDINDASRQIKSTEVDGAATKGVDYLEIPIALDGLTIVVNPENYWVDYLTLQELSVIWGPGSDVHSWKDIRDEWPDLPIRLYAPGTDSGTFEYFTEAINGESGSVRTDFTASEDDNVLVQGIHGDEYALGFFGYAYFQANRSLLKVVPVDNGMGPIEPNPQTISSGEYSPLSRQVYLYLNKASLARKEVQVFMDFYLEHAATLSEEVGYIAMDLPSYDEARLMIDTLSLEELIAF